MFKITLFLLVVFYASIGWSLEVTVKTVDGVETWNSYYADKVKYCTKKESVKYCIPKEKIIYVKKKLEDGEEIVVFQSEINAEYKEDYIDKESQEEASQRQMRAKASNDSPKIPQFNSSTSKLRNRRAVTCKSTSRPQFKSVGGSVA